MNVTHAPALELTNVDKSCTAYVCSPRGDYGVSRITMQMRTATATPTLTLEGNPELTMSGTS